MSEMSNGRPAPDGWPLVMAYVPWQTWGETYDERRALELGTLFPALFYPFTGREAGRR